MRRPWEKLDDGSSAGTQGARQLELSQREPVRDLQQSAGNRALLGLLSGSPVVQKKAKDSETAETTTAPAAPSLIVEDDAKDLKSGQMRKGEFLSQLRTAVCDTAEQALAEINVRIDTERFLIRNGWPPFDPAYRNSDGTVNEQAIRDDIMGSSHYNPIGRHRTGRRYQGERRITGWRVP